MSVQQDGRTDFDFLMGKWSIHSRRLRERLKGSNDWEEFAGTSAARKILDGLGNTDEVTFERESGKLLGFTLRLFDPKSQEWNIYWSSNLTGTLDKPMIGKFVDGRGEFYAHERHDGKHVFSRFIWSVFNGNSCRWEQALSPDGGRTWETNWVMDFTRLE